MANVTFFSPDGGTTRYPIEDTEARNRIDNNFQLLRDGEVIEGKNKLEITGSSSYTDGGVTFVVNSDKSVTVDTNGVASSTNARFVLQMPIKHLVNGEEYVISGTPNDIDGTKAYVGISDWDTTNYDDTTGEGAEFTMFNPESYPNARIYIFVKSGTTLSNKVFKPMICTLEEWNKSHTYEPYYVPLKDSKLDIVDQQVVGAWNLLPNEATTQTVNGVVCTVNDDKSITLNGTATGNVRLQIGSVKLKPGTYYLSGGANSEFYLNIINGISSYDYNGTAFTVDTEGTYTVQIAQNGTHTANNLVIKPMISLQPNTPYSPWCMTNRELTEVVNVTNRFTGENGVSFDSSSKWNKIYRCGKLLTGRIRFTTPNIEPTETNIITVPSDLAPIDNEMFLCPILITWSGDNAGTLAYANGHFLLMNVAWIKNVDVVCEFSYIIK